MARVAADEQVSLALTLPLRNPQSLADLLSRLYNPSDPLFGRYLTPDQFAAGFGPTEADYAAVVHFATSQGLRIVNTHPNRTVLDVAGTAADVETAFGVVLNRYVAPNGRAFRAPDREPSIPRLLAGKLSGIAGLDTAAEWRSHAVCRSLLQRPTSTGGTGPDGALCPSDIKAAYNLSGVALTGAGQTLGLFELDGFAPSDITAYVNHFSLAAPTVQRILVDSATGASGSGAPEVTLDIELQIALAPGAAKILVYEGPNSGVGVIDTYNRIATDNTAAQISTSWGLDEGDTGLTELNAESAIFQQMAAQGQSIFAASGDSGAYDNYGVVRSATLSVDDPASQPYVTGVGGTTVSTSGAGGPWLSETTWNGGSPANGAGGGGISQYWSIPSYQSGVGATNSLRSTTMRNVPDISMNADPGNGYSVYFGGGWTVYGGTSCAAPLWSALAALVNQQRSASGDAALGFANPTLYALGTGVNYGSVLHDVADGSTNLHYPAVAGYDLATGWGSPNGANLIAAAAPSNGSNPTPTLSGVSPSSATAGSGATTITLTGASFVSGAQAQWNGSALTTTFVSTTRLTAVLPSSDLTTGGTDNITVVNPGAGSPTSGAVTFTILNPTPVLTGISPASGTAGGTGLTVSLTGTHFVVGATAQWGGVAMDTNYPSPTRLTASVSSDDLATAGTFNITVVNPGSGSLTSGAMVFTVKNGLPRITGVSPSSATVGSSATTITVSGVNMVADTQIMWSGVALATTYVSATQMTAVIPSTDLTAAGTFSLTAVSPGPGGGTSSSFTFSVINATPTITAASPNVVTVGSPDTTITLTGTGFASGAVAKWNAAALATTYVAATQLTVVVPASDMATARTSSITVVNPGPHTPTSGPVSILASNPSPTLSSISPNSVTAGGGNLTVIATGTGFVSSSRAQWNGTSLSTTYSSPTTLSFVIPTGDTAIGGVQSVTIVNPTPGGGASTSVSFTVVNASPTLSSLSPSSAPAGSANVTVIATGTGFVSTSQAQWDGTALSTSRRSATTLSFIIPKGDLTDLGSHSITITSPTPGGGTSGAVTFAIVNPSPTLSSVTPSSVVFGSADLTVTGAGAGFMTNSVAQCDGVALATTYLSSKTLSFVIPSGDLAAAGTHQITIATPTPGGGTSSGVTFTVKNPLPTVTGLSPNSVALGSSDLTVTAVGTGFLSTSQAQWDGAALATTYSSATTLTFVIPSGDLGTAGAHKITIKSPTPGGGVSAPATFTINNPTPTLSALSVTSAATKSSAITVTATGSGFLPNSQARWNTSSLSTTYSSGTTLSFVIPANVLVTAGTRNITIKNASPGGGTSQSITFTVE